MRAFVWRNYHRKLGILLFLPFLAWIATGLIFHGELGYKGAYESLKPKTYPLGNLPVPKFESSWTRARLIRTCLGPHLLVEQGDEVYHLDPRNGSEWVPTISQVRALVHDAIQARPRYGQIVECGLTEARTSTGVHIEVDWQRLAFFQRGRDTLFINRLWAIHRLRWTGVSWLDRSLGWVMLVLSTFLLMTGSRLIGSPKKKPLSDQRQGHERKE